MNIMNLVLRFSLLSVLFLFSCKSNTDTHFLTVETTVISFSPEQGKQVISCSSDAKVEVVSSHPSWCTAIVVAFQNNIEIEISVLRNSGVARTAYLTLTAGNAEAVQIEVRQDSEAPYINIIETDLQFDSPSSLRNVTVISNVDFKAISSAPAWCTVDVIETGFARSLSISVTQNAGISPRTAQIAIAAPGIDQIVIRVNQKGFFEIMPEMTVYGWVGSNNTGLPGVVVSDGFEVTVTDANGVYYLPSEKTHGYVFISIPGNYEVPVVDNIPQFFQSLKAGASTVERVDFELIPVNNDKHAVIVFTDVHLRNAGHNEIHQFNTYCLPDMNSLIDSYQTDGTKTYALALGDIIDGGSRYANFGLTDYKNVIKGLNTCIFNVKGNHDQPPSSNYFEAKQPWKDIVGPLYYSFNLGKAHYVVLDNFEHDWTQRIIEEQFEWLTKDLAHVADKSAPLIIAMHNPLYNRPDVNNIATVRGNGQQLITILNNFGFTNVIVLGGHLHTMSKFDPPAYPGLKSHTLAALCGYLWMTRNWTDVHICAEGAPGGYVVYEIDDKNVQWYHKGIGFDRDYQFRSYDRNSIHLTAEVYAPAANPSFAAINVPLIAAPYHIESAENEVLINVWGYDTGWKIEVMEGAESLPVTRVRIKDPLSLVNYEFQRLNLGFFDDGSHFSTNFFKVNAKSPISTLHIKITDRFGNVYTETMTRPKELTVNSI